MSREQSTSHGSSCGLPEKRFSNDGGVEQNVPRGTLEVVSILERGGVRLLVAVVQVRECFT